MFWLGPRVAATILATLLAGCCGYWVGVWADAPLLGALVGSALGAGAASALDAYHGSRLLNWLRRGGEGTAPGVRGLWAELAWRCERLLRVQTDGRLRERERLTQFLAAIEASPNGVLLLDANEQIQWLNRTAADHLGLDPTRDLQQRITNLVRAPAFVQYLQSASFDPAVQVRSPDDNRWLLMLIRPYGDGQRLLLTQDVTERERSEGMRRDFVANVSHEIRTPLTVLAGFIESLQQLTLTPAEYTRVLELMTQQTGRMRLLVEDLLTLAQLEGSPRPPTDTWVPLSRIIERTEADALALSAKRHQLRFEGPASLMLAGNEREFASALSNLVTNAVRYTPAGGQIDVQWGRRSDGAAEIDVRDTGPGIARVHLPRLTERFYRVDASRARETGGTGLGLAIVKHVMQRHGGELAIDSELGKGSSFRLVFPPGRVLLEADVAEASVRAQS